MSRLLTAGIAVAALVASVATATTAGATDGATTRSYTPSDKVIANPERGFYHHQETHYYADGTGYAPLNVDTLRSFRQDEHVTLITRMFYLEKFAKQDRLDFVYLDHVQADFDALRTAGMKANIRFAYALPHDSWPFQPPYGDAPLDRVLNQIHQLTPLLRKNADVINVVQAGFIGLWGEWYYTDYFVTDPTNPGNVTDADMAKRRAVVLALLHALPKDRMIQLRTPNLKQRIFGLSTGTQGALTPAQGFDGSDVARVGQHNDCFLASPDDYGTFVSDPITLDEGFMAQDTYYTPMGGEVCNPNPPRSAWPSASAEMARFHYSYLNTDYNKAVLSSWGDNIDTVKQRLGYRFVLTQGVYTNSVRPGSSFGVQLDIRNDGWASPFNPRLVQLVLRGSNGHSYRATLPADPRRWQPGATTHIAANVCAALPPGTYHLSLNLADPNPLLHSQKLMPGSSETYNSAYAIQLANQGTWDSKTGYNDLGQVLTVTPGGHSDHQCRDDTMSVSSEAGTGP